MLDSVGIVKWGVALTSLHVPRQAPPLTVELLRAVVGYFRSTSPDARVLTIALLLDFFTLFRQGILLVICHSHDPGNTIITNNGNTLLICVRSPKTIQSPAAVYTIKLSLIGTTCCCPVCAWCAYKFSTAIYPDAAAFLKPYSSQLCEPPSPRPCGPS